VKPAWHEAFEPGALQYPPSLPALHEITPEWAWGGSTGRGVRVAVIDSGINNEHQAVAGAVRGYVRIVDENGQYSYDESPHTDLFGHGTACAGLIHKVAPQAELYSVQVLSPTGGGTGGRFAAGLQWAIEHEMQVCNLSLGTTKKDWYAALHELADTAYFKNVILITAANNVAQPSFPSMYASVISVACNEEQDPFRFFFNPTPPVDFGAPGIDVQVAWQDGGYATMTGNSFAAPHMTAIVALILGKHPGLTPFLVKTILHATARNVGHAAPEDPPAAAPGD
jgi:subtilisin family serine protease